MVPVFIYRLSHHITLISADLYTPNGLCIRLSAICIFLHNTELIIHIMCCSHYIGLSSLCIQLDSTIFKISTSIFAESKILILLSQIFKGIDSILFRCKSIKLSSNTAADLYFLSCCDRCHPSHIWFYCCYIHRCDRGFCHCFLQYLLCMAALIIAADTVNFRCDRITSRRINIIHIPVIIFGIFYFISEAISITIFVFSIDPGSGTIGILYFDRKIQIIHRIQSGSQLSTTVYDRHAFRQDRFLY